jgi:ceramide glucosyltransferase
LAGHGNVDMMHQLAGISAAITVIGMSITVFGLLAAARFGRPAAGPVSRPPVSILKPLCGDEPMLEHALESFCRLNYPEFELILGVQDPADPALLAVERVRQRFPACLIKVVVDPALHGPNRKVSNLINMLPAAQHDLLVFSDSDLHVASDYLDRLVAGLQRPGVGLVTTVCFGMPAHRRVVSVLGAMQISYSFLPGVLLSRVLGRQDCLGTTMALHRGVLTRAGGLAQLLQHLADDHVLGQAVLGLGMSIGLADTLPATCVPETSLAALWAHELRWARTIGALAPLPYLSSTLQFPLFWAVTTVLFSDGAGWSVALFLAAWLVRACCAFGIGHILRGPPVSMPLLTAGLMPARDVLSIVLTAASFCGHRVLWRGHEMHADEGLPARALAVEAD